MTLDQLPIGRCGAIASIEMDAPWVNRLAAQGLQIGQSVEVLRRAAWKGPLHVRVVNTEIILRQRDAARIHLANLCNMEDQSA